jgi:ABC-type transport system involved in cytochrome c biogenesis permease subunit
VWTSYRWWLTLSATFSTVYLQIARHGWRSVVTLKDVVVNAAGGAITTFIGSFIISLFRSPVLLDSDRGNKIETLNAALESARRLLDEPPIPQIELDRRESAVRKLEGFSLQERAVIHCILQHGSANHIWLSEKFGPFVARDAISKAAMEGLLEASYSDECSIKSIFHDSLADYFAKNRPVTPSSD